VSLLESDDLMEYLRTGAHDARVPSLSKDQRVRRPTSRSVLSPPAGDVKGVSQPPSRVSRDALTASA
jgi:hypothetical protein